MAEIPDQYANCGTALVYNNVAIGDAKLEQFEQVAHYDQSNTDLLRHEFLISVSGWIHSDNLPGMGTYTMEAGVTGGLLAPEVPQVEARRLQEWMMHPRGNLHVYNEGVLLFRSLGVVSLGVTDGKRNLLETGTVNDKGNLTSNPIYSDLKDYDVENGPKPQSCSVTFVAGRNAFQIRFTIKTSRAVCNADLTAQNPAFSSEDLPDGSSSGGNNPDAPDSAGFNMAVLSNRWSITESRDESFAFTRTFSGQLKVRSYSLYAHAFRNLCLPVQVRGYRRTRMEFVQSPDGLTLDYSITDVQSYACPPRPAIDWKATHIEHVESLGHTGRGTIQVWLKGSIAGRKADLFAAAMAVIEHRLTKINLAITEFQVIPISSTVVDVLNSPEITVTTVVSRTVVEGAVNKKSYANMVYSMLGNLPAVNSVVPDEPDLPGVNPGDPDKPEPNNEVRNDSLQSQHGRDKWPHPIAYDSKSPAGMFVTYLQSPCVGHHGIPWKTDAVIQNADEGSDSEYPSRDETAIYVFEGEMPTVNFSPDNPASTQIRLQHAQHLYTSYEIESKYVTEGGVQALPIARLAGSSESQISTARVSHPITYRDVWVRGARVGAKPEIPEAPQTVTDEVTGITEVLTYVNIVPCPPKLLTNGQQYEYEMEVFYRYVLNRTPTTSEKLKSGSLPWDITTTLINSIAMNEVASSAII